MRFDKHIFICTNTKTEGKKCCGEERGIELVKEFRKQLIEKGLKGKVRAQRAGCLDACEFGPTVVVYPEGTHYGNISSEKISAIIENHIINNKPIEEWIIKF